MVARRGEGEADERFAPVVAALSLAACQGRCRSPAPAVIRDRRRDPSGPRGPSGRVPRARRRHDPLEPGAAPPRLPYEAIAPGKQPRRQGEGPVMTGLPLYHQELAAVTANRGWLPGMVDAWSQTPQFKEWMFDFFKWALVLRDPAGHHPPGLISCWAQQHRPEPRRSGACAVPKAVEGQLPPHGHWPCLARRSARSPRPYHHPLHWLKRAADGGEWVYMVDGRPPNDTGRVGGQRLLGDGRVRAAPTC